MDRSRAVKYLNHRLSSHNHFTEVDIDFFKDFIEWRTEDVNVDRQQLRQSIVSFPDSREKWIEALINFLVKEFDIKVKTSPDANMDAFKSFLNVPINSEKIIRYD